MVKGISKRVVIVRPQQQDMFEEAIFIVKGDAGKSGCTPEDIVKEACRVANSYGGKKDNAKWILPAPLFTLFGALAMGAVWLITVII